MDLKFTARLEESLDSVEKGVRDWKSLLGDFYAEFDASLKNAETALEGERIKIPDEVSDEVCDVCGRQMVVKSGRFGRFLACPGYPECSFTKPLVIEMPGTCPRCANRILKRTSKNGYTYYACERLKECGFMTWDVPTKDVCAECGKTMFKKSGRGYNKPFCTNPECPNFLPEDKRGYRRKPSAGADAEAPGAADAKTTSGTASKKPAAGKSAEKKAPSGKTPAKKGQSKAAKSSRSKTTKKTAEAKP